MDRLDAVTSSADAIAMLRDRIPGFPKDFEGRTRERLKDVLAHTQMQGLIFLCGSLLPDVPRDAFLADATGDDLVHWLSRIEPQPAKQLSVGKRGSYRTVSVSLRPLVESDLGSLYLAALEPQHAHRWRYRGATPSPEQFRESIYNGGVVAQFMVIDESDPSEPIGFVSAYSPNMVARQCCIAMERLDNGATSDGSSTRGLMVEGIFAFVQFLFDHLNFRKLYLEAPEYNLSLFSDGVQSLLKNEGRMPGHFYYGDRFWDQVVFALYKEDWDSIAKLVRADWDDGFERNA